MKNGKKKNGCLTTLLICVGLIAALLIALAVIRSVKMHIRNKTPEGGINESMYVDINGTKQWINIYGQKKENPVLLYLHGGPGNAVSPLGGAVTKKWTDVYTVVTWDQRNCGKSYSADQNGTPITLALMMQDGKEMTELLRQHLGAEKITLLGHSWGSYLGANLALEYPEYYDCFIGVGQLTDWQRNEEMFEEAAKKWVGADQESRELLKKLGGAEHDAAKAALLSKYRYSDLDDGFDFNSYDAMVNNPWYSLKDWSNYFSTDRKVYNDFFASEEFRSFSLFGRTDYEMPYYNINGGADYMVNYELAQTYFDTVNAPRKKLYLMADTRHGLLLAKTEEFSEILHEIAAAEHPQ